MRIGRIGRCSAWKLICAASMAAIILAQGQAAHAYNGSTHHSFPSLGWEVMRAASDPLFGNNIDWRPTSVIPGSTPTPPTPFSTFGACANCGTGATPALWSTFLARIPTSLTRLNGMNPGLSVLKCNNASKLSDDGTLKGMNVAIATEPSFTADVSDCTDKFIGKKLQGFNYDQKWHPGGIFDFTHPNPAIDGDGAYGYQGLLLGWHAKTGDDHIDDSVMESLWLLAGKAGLYIVLGLVALGLLATVGLAGIAVIAATVLVMALLFCIGGLISGTGCGNGIVDGFTSIIEAAHDPITQLDKHVPELDAMIPRGGDVKGSNYTGMWHYVDARKNPGHDYDDREGLNYDDGGPDHRRGQFDLMIMAGIDLGDFHLGYDESDGPKNYEIGTSSDGHQASEIRSWAEWQGPTAAHIPFSPLDNFGFYGWSHFLSTKDAHWLGWPLHALGDATVPMHVSGTSSWGHRPYEDSLGWGESWNAVRFLDCVPENGGCAQKCFADRTNPAVHCPERTGVDSSNGADLKIENYQEQWKQARRILEHAFRWTQFINAWRTRTGKTTDIPVRDMITALADETMSQLDETAGEAQWPWCDNCSMDWILPGVLGGQDNHQGMNFYKSDDSIGKERNLIERGVGATIAFLMATADAVPALTCSTTTCSATMTCCGGTTCTGGKCCAPAAAACDHDADCCGGTGTGATMVCRNRACVAKTAGVCQQTGNTCEDGASQCCADSAGAKQCGHSGNGETICCSGGGAACTSNSDCCDGACDIVIGNVGTCRKKPPGGSCSADAQCQSPATCQSASVIPTLPPFAPVGTCCLSSATGDLDCEADSDCCTGVCTQTGNDQFKCRCAPAGTKCGSDADCCAGNACQNGVCTKATCSGSFETCNVDDDCCEGSCCHNYTGGNQCSHGNNCACTPDGELCAKDTDCCLGNTCQRGVCHPPNTTCNPVSSACTESSPCCAGTVCCDTAGFRCATTCAPKCTARGASCSSPDECCNFDCCNTDGTCGACEVK